MAPENSLKDYLEKRDFRKTREPKGEGRAPSSKPIFVIQKHQARSLHYDFRLEVDGVLKSWAIPKGPSTDPRDKRLAVPTEDHPLDYADFEGIIPKGEYGGGAVLVWDAGKYRNIREEDGEVIPMEQCIEDGKVTVLLEGGYRFSFLAGFRQEHWENFGNNRGSSVTTASLRDDLWSQIPFLGFQTTMSFPFWSARFEFFGSPFMKRRVVGHWLQDNAYAYYDGTGTDGRFLSFRLWGFGTVWRSLALGIDTHLSYQELYGHFTSTDNHHSEVQTYKVMLRESYATFGLFLSYVF